MKSKIGNRFRHIVKAHLLRMKGRVLLAALCMTAYIAAELLAPWPLKLIFDHVLLERPLPASLAPMSGLFAAGKTTAVIALAASILLLALLRGSFSYAQLYLTSFIGHRLVFTLRQELFAHVQRLPLGFHQRTRAGELLNKLTGDTQTLRDVFSGAALEFATQVLILIGMFCILFLLNWRLSLAALATFPFLGYAIFSVYRKIKISARKQREKEGRVAARVSEVFGAVHLVKAFARENHEQKLFDAENSETLNDTLRTSRLEARASRAVEVINSCGICLVVLFGALLVVRGEMTPGGVLIFTAYLTSMYKPLRSMAKLTTQFSRAQVSAERISMLLETKTEEHGDGGVKVGRLHGDIRFGQVWFGYEPSQMVLRSVSFAIQPGQLVALVGSSGAGKSTIANLLMRMYSPQSGAIFIDGRDARGIDRQSLRNQIAVVLQDSLLFGFSIRDNIAYGKPGATMEEIVLAAKHAHAHEFILGLPDGYDTMLGERGCTLSGGQRQRLCLARALLKESSIVLLDEPTAAIDAESSALIDRTIAAWRRGKTTLVITHSFSNMQKYDKIIVLKQGKVLEIGTHQQLLAARGYYFDLYRLQGRGGDDSPAPAPPRYREQSIINL